MNPSQPQHCIGNVRSHVRSSRAEHISQSKHKDQNVPQRWGNEGHSNSTRNTAQKKRKKNVNCRQGTKDGWVGEPREARIVLLAVGRRHGGRTHSGEDVITIPCRDWPRWPTKRAWSASAPSFPYLALPFLVPQTRSTGAGTLGGGAAIEGAARKALWSRPRNGSSRFPSRRSLSVLVGRMATGGYGRRRGDGRW